jgi:hypothetical protein
MVITAETVRLTVIRSRHTTPQFVWCESCQEPVWMVTTDTAAALNNTTVRDIFRRVEAGELHFIETKAAQLLICRASLE